LDRPSEYRRGIVRGSDDGYQGFHRGIWLIWWPPRIDVVPSDAYGSPKTAEYFERIQVTTRLPREQ
jgi:hypothetical protein